MMSTACASEKDDVPMFPMLFWVVVMSISVSALVMSAAARPLNPIFGFIHLALSAGSVSLIALFLIRDIQGAIKAGGSRMLVAAAKSRAMAVIWAWGALCLLATYGTGALVWSNWWKFTLPFAAVGGLCAALASFLTRQDDEGHADETLLRFLSRLAKGQLAAMLVVMAWLLVGGRMMRLLDQPGSDWAAYNILFFGAAVLGFLSLYVVSPAAQALEAPGRAARPGTDADR